jgi:uncharacterized SAM-binding protein YcdF (DUF218 family)
MFFILSKTLNYLVMPVTMICLAFLLSVLLRNAKWKKRCFWIGFSLLFFFSNEFISNEAMRAWEIPSQPIASLPQYELAIVLTGTTMTHEPNDRVYFTKGADRVTHTVQLYKEGYVKRILISGGSGRLTEESEPEANRYQRAMVMMGVDPAHILIENETRNTAESAIQVKALLAKLGYSDKQSVLITSAFHMRRSLACYRKQGMDPDVFSTDFYSHERDFYFDTLFIPQVDPIMNWNKLIKEWVGFVAYKLAGYV